MEGLEDRGSGGSEQLFLRSGREHGRAAKKFGGGGRGNGQDSVGAADGASSDVEGGAIPGVGGEELNGYGRADDVHDGVFRANLVEMNGLRGLIVNGALGLGQKLKRVEGEGLGDGADGRAGDDLSDLGESAMDVGGSGRVVVGV
jgi:hypothetical protein